MQRSDALTFLKAHSCGSLATVSAEGTPRVRTLYYSCDDSLSVYLLTLANTRKVSDMHSHPQAAFVVTDTEKNQTLQIEGVFEEITDTATFGPMLSELTSRLFPEGKPSAPITHMDAAKPLLFKLVPTWIRFGDFSETNASKEAFSSVLQSDT